MTVPRRRIVSSCLVVRKRAFTFRNLAYSQSFVYSHAHANPFPTSPCRCLCLTGTGLSRSARPETRPPLRPRLLDQVWQISLPVSVATASGESCWGYGSHCRRQSRRVPRHLTSVVPRRPCTVIVRPKVVSYCTNLVLGPDFWQSTRVSCERLVKGALTPRQAS